MIDFRYHVVSIIAVFLALALGLVLGSTTLQGTVTHNLSKQAARVTAENRADERKIDDLEGSLTDEEAFTAAIEPHVVADQLLGSTVAVVAAPGVDDSTRRDLATTITSAGATITANLALSPAYLDRSKDAELGQLATELARHQRRLTGATGADKLAQVLANAIVAKPGGHAISGSRQTSTLQTLVAANLLTVDGQPPGRTADLAVLLVPGPTSGESADAARAQDDFAVVLATALHAGATGLVVTGPQATTGPMFAVTKDAALANRISTVVDVASDPAAGRIATVLALAAGRDGSAGAYGIGAGTPLPTPTASPSP